MPYTQKHVSHRFLKELKQRFPEGFLMEDAAEVYRTTTHQTKSTRWRLDRFEFLGYVRAKEILIASKALDLVELTRLPLTGFFIWRVK